MKQPNKREGRPWMTAAAIVLAGLVLSLGILLLRPFSPNPPVETPAPSPTEDGTCYSLRFYGADGALLEEISAPGGRAVLPPAQEAAGQVFKGWSGEEALFSVRADGDFYPELLPLEPDAKNVFRGGAVYADGEAPILVPIRLDGAVDCSGFALEIEYDAALLRFEAAEGSLPGLRAEDEAEQGLLTLRYEGEPLGEALLLTELRFTCRNPGAWKTQMALRAREILTRRGAETVYTDGVAYDTELYIFDHVFHKT